MAGVAEVEAHVTSPIGQNVPVRITETQEGIHNVEFIPNMPGTYKVGVFYGGEPVQGSPINFIVSSTGWKNDSRAIGNGLEVAHRGKESSFVVYCPTTPNVQIESADEFSERIEPKLKVNSL